MPAVGPNSVMASFAGANVSPEILAKYKRLLGGPEREAAADPATPADASMALNPVFQSPDEQAFSLAGKAPVGDRVRYGAALLGGPEGDPARYGAALGAAFLREPDPEPESPERELRLDPSLAGIGEESGPAYGRQAASDVEPPRPARRRAFEETTGGKTALSLMEKRKGMSWLLPDFFANRNERDLAQALELARLEMAGDDQADAGAQRWAKLLGERLEGDRQHERWRKDDSDEESASAFQRKRQEDSLRLDEARLGIDERNAKAREAELEETRRYRASLEAKRRKAESEQQRGMPRDVLKIAASRLLSQIDPKDPEALDKVASELQRFEEEYVGARAGGAPSAGARVAFRRDPRTGALVRVP